MGSKYVVAAGGNSNASSTWSNVSSASAGGDGVPTASDDVFLDAGSGQLTINAAMVCRSIDCNGYTGTLTHNGSTTVTIGDATAGAGNIAFRLVSGMTYTKGNNTNSALSFISTSATQQSIYCGGKVLGNVTFNAASNGSWIFADAFKADASVSTTVTLTRGSLDTGGFSVNTSIITFNNSNTKSLTLGASTVTLGGLNPWVAGATGTTISAASSTISMSAQAATFAGAGLSYGTVVFTGNGSCSVTGANTFANLTRTGTAAKTDGLTFFASQTVTGTVTLTGNSKTNRLLIASDTIGTARTITAATVSCNAVDFRDITGAGAGSWDLSAVSDYSGNCGGNSGITFTTPATQTATGTASFTWSTHGWTSRVPLPQDDVVVNNAFIAGRTVTMDMPRAGKSVSFNGCSGSPTFSAAVSWSLFGSLDLTGVGTLSASATTFEGRGAYTLTSAGRSFTTNVTTEAPGGSLTLQDAFSNSANLVNNRGDFSANGFSVTAAVFSSASIGTKTVTLGSGTWTLTSTGTVWNIGSSGVTVAANTSTIIVNNTTATAKTFSGAAQTYNNLTVSGDNVTISGANTFATLAVNTAGLTNGLKLTSSVTQTVSNITTNGSAGNLAKLVSSSAGTAATIVKSGGGTITTDYMSIQDITLSTTNSPVWYAGSHSTNVSGNTNITFTDPPGGAAASMLLLLGVG